MEHFKVLPTDPRYLELTEFQIDLLFFHYLIKPEDDLIKKWYQKENKAEDLVESLPEHLLINQGYTKAQIEQIKREIGEISISHG